MLGRFRLAKYLISQFKYLWVAFCLIIILGIFVYHQKTGCRDVCGQVISYTEGGRFLLGPQYHIFKLSDAFGVRVSSNSDRFEDILTGSTIFCRFHAIQVAFFTREKRPNKLFGKYPIIGSIMLQMRHDAMIGLPGGSVRVNETLMQGLRRELFEEVGLDQPLSSMDYQLSYANPQLEYCGHLFTKEMSWIELHDLMVMATASSDIGVENQGYFLMPTLNEVDDDPGFDGLPTLLAQAIAPASPPTMVGNTLQQLLYVLTEATNPPIVSHKHMLTSIGKACELLTLSSCPTLTGKKLVGATLSNFYE